MCLAAIVGVQMASASASKVHQPSRLRARLALAKDVTRNGRKTRFGLFPLRHTELETSLRRALFAFAIICSPEKLKFSFIISWPADR